MARVKEKTINEVFVDDEGTVRVIYHSAQTAPKLKRTVDRALDIMQKLITKDKPVRLLVDIRDMGPYDQPARLVELHARTVLPFWKMAMVTTGEGPESEIISRQLTSMSGRRSEIRYFKREDDALGWLSFMR
jgi:hypothetical protein